MSLTGIRFYIEGAPTGSKSNAAKADARKAFHIFLTEIRDVASKQKLEWHSISICGSRQKAYETFCDAIKKETNTFHVLLVDAEENVSGESYESGEIWNYLSKRSGDSWKKPSEAEDHHVYLMVRTMETWIIADRDKLTEYYKKNFNTNALPSQKNLEVATKSQVYAGLKKATENTAAKAYHKTKHAFAILETIRPSVVSDSCPSCRRLFTELPKILQAV